MLQIFVAGQTNAWKPTLWIRTFSKWW